MRTLSNILFYLAVSVLAWPLMGCGHTTFEVKKGGLDLHGRSYNEEVMAMAASKAYTNVVNAETCAEAAKNGNACSTADVMVTPQYGTGGFGGGGMNGNAMCSLYGVCGGVAAPDDSAYNSPTNAAPQGQSSSSAPVTREELDAVKAQAARAERMGKASIDANKRVVKSLAGAGSVSQSQPAAASSPATNATQAPTTVTAAPEPASANLPAP